MRRSILFAIISFALVVALALSAQSASAASNGQVTNVCVTGQTVYVTVSAVGSTQDTPTGDQIGVSADSLPTFWTSIPVDHQAHSITASFLLAAYQLQSPILVQAGNGDGNQNPSGAPFAGSGYYAATPCVFAGPVAAGPGVPAGFVLHTITCTVPVFNTPGGSPVGSNVILGGQTWYVNPTPVTDRFGRFWTEIFVAGPVDAFIPTPCVH